MVENQKENQLEYLKGQEQKVQKQRGQYQSGQKKLTLDIPKTCSASLIPGRSRNINGKFGGTNLGHNGDAIYIDLNHRIFAVADGPERNPSASSNYLKKLKKCFEDSTPIQEGLSDLSGGSFGGAIEMLGKIATDLSLNTDYHNATTFSALALAPSENGKCVSDGGKKGEIDAAILHTGDSMIFKISESGGEIVRLTKTNHFLIGRAPRLFQTETIVVYESDIILLCTDGINDLARSRGLATEKFLSEEVVGLGPAGIIEKIESLAKDTKIRLDDIGVVCVQVSAAISQSKQSMGGVEPGVILEDAGS